MRSNSIIAIRASACRVGYRRYSMTAMNPHIFLFCALFVLSGCDVFKLSEESDILTGRWSSAVEPASGACCQLDLTLQSRGNNVEGTGFVITPGNRIGTFEQFAIEVAGTFDDDRLQLSLVSKFNPGTISGMIDKEFSEAFSIVLRVDFEGFGHTGEDIVLFPRTSS